MTDKNTPQPVLTDEEIMRSAINASDSLNITRFHEMGAPSRTIMDDAGLLELGRAIETAVLSKLRAPVADERVAFEAWATAIADKYDVTRNGDHYMEPYTEWAWEAWQARAALAAQPGATESYAERIADDLADAIFEHFKTPAGAEGDESAWDHALAVIKAAQPAASAEPSDTNILAEWAFIPNSGDMRVDLVAFARALLSRYGRPAGDAQPSDALSENEWYDLAQRHATQDWNGNGYMAAIQAVCLDFLSRYGRPAGGAQPVAWVAADTLNSPHPKSISSLAYMSQIDQDRGREYVPLYAAPVAAQTADDARDAAFEAVRQHLCKLQRYSFIVGPRGGVRRVKDRVGNWIEFDAVHELFDPVAVDAAIAQQRQGEGGAA